MDTNIIMDANTISTTPPNGRKRNRENETPSQRMKREKAAERQRRKRERDRLGIPVNYVHPPPQRNPANPVSIPPPAPAPPVSQPPSNEQDLTPEEISRRDRVRAAARDRQRKHRALVKQRKMRELGMDMGNDISGAVQGSSADGQGPMYTDPQAGFHATMISPPPPGMIQPSLSDDPSESSFPPNVVAPGHGGQMFATTLLLSFSCAPLLKQHLLNSLQMSNEELASLEPIIAEAWDQWDRQRRQPQQPFDASQPFPNQQPFVPNPPSSAPPPDGNATTSATANEFRARFHRSLVVPTPFQAQAAAAAVAVAQAQANAAAAHAVASQTTVSGSLNAMPEEEGDSSGPKSERS
jgi:hypothetical protein